MPLGREVDIWKCLPTSTVTTGIAAWMLSFEISALRWMVGWKGMYLALCVTNPILWVQILF